MNELKPVAYMHYYIDGYAPDGYIEESELVELRDFHKFEGMESDEREGITPLYAIPEGVQLVPIELLRTIAVYGNRLCKDKSIDVSVNFDHAIGEIEEILEAAKGEVK